MAKLSVVICVYNTEESYFENCLNSIYDSTIAKDLEVVVVDDGSTVDYSELMKKFHKVKYFKTENKGTLAARGFGVKQTTSPCVCFVDSDDTISFNYFEASLTQLTNTNSDIVINDWAFHTAQSKYVCMNDSTIKKNLNYEGDIPIRRFMWQAGREHSFYVLWNKIFKREVLIYACEKAESQNLEKFVFAEDVLISFFAFSFAKKVTNTHLGYYFYRIHESQQISATTEQKLKNHIDSMTAVFKIMETNLKEMKIFDDVSLRFQMWKQLLCSNHYQSAKRMKFKSLYPLLTEKYDGCKLKRMPSDYSKSYMKQRVLPKNLKTIDDELKKVYYSNKYLKVYAKRNSYAFASLCTMKVLFKKKFDIVVSKKKATFVMTKEKVLFKQKILHSDIVYKIGLVLFPKGSKIRRYLKSKL